MKGVRIVPGQVVVTAFAVASLLKKGVIFEIGVRVFDHLSGKSGLMFWCANVWRLWWNFVRV